MANPFSDNGMFIPQFNPHEWEQEWVQNFDWNQINGDLISQTAQPGMVQFSEWSQQMLSQMYQNWWNSEEQRMLRGSAAGINPYLLANGVAGASSPSVSAPNSAVGAAASSLGSIAQLGGAAAELFGKGVQGITQLFKLKGELKNLDADYKKKFIDMGFTELQSEALSIQMKYLDDKERIGIFQALANLDKTKQEYQNLKALHQNIIAQYDEILVHKDLLIAEKGEVEAKKELDLASAAKLKLEAQWQDIDINFFQKHHYRLGTPMYDSLRDMVVGGVDVDAYNFGSVIGNYQGQLDNIYFAAQARASWDSRPQTAFELGAMYTNRLGNTVMNILRQNPNANAFLNSLEKISNKEAKSDFDIAFDDARSDLYNNYRYARSEYRKYKNTGISDTEKAKLYDRMKSAKQEYDSFTREKFADSLCKSFRW